MTARNALLCGSALLLVGVAVGRYTVPEKVKIETKTVTVEKLVSDTELEKHKNTKIVEKTLPDGSKEKVTIIDEDSDTKKHSTVDKAQETETHKEIVRGDSKVTISALAGFTVFGSMPVASYGASISKPVLGPITIGVWGLSSGLIGASLGLTF